MTILTIEDHLNINKIRRYLRFKAYFDSFDSKLSKYAIIFCVKRIRKIDDYFRLRIKEIIKESNFVQLTFADSICKYYQMFYFHISKRKHY
jgi:hypothetical protein